MLSSHGGWTRHESTKYPGKVYFFHAPTNRTTWEMPPEFCKAKKPNGRNPPKQSDETRIIAKHYGQRLLGKNMSKKKRKQSTVYELRQWNNFVKAAAIQSAIGPKGRQASERFTIVDAGCGRGGDLSKWSNQIGVKRYVGYDMCEQRLTSARRRATRSTLGVTFFKGDLKDPKVLSNYVEPQEAQVVSAMFAIHYAFGTDANALSFFQSTYRALSPGGVLVGTRVNPIKLKGYMKTGMTWSNRVCSVECERSHGIDHQLSESTHCGGLRYFFSLKDSVDKCPEYVVGKETFCGKAQSVGFQNIEFMSFPEFAKEKALEFPDMYKAMIRDHRYCTTYGPPEMNCHQVFELYDVFFATKPSSEAQ